MKFIYNFGILCYYTIIKIASLFNEKARLWIQGRKDWEKELQKKLNGVTGSIWIHCASLGEFEQGRPVIESLKKQKPEAKILLTFFSPSGFEIRRNYAMADCICYLPLDSSYNAQKFISIVNPSLAIFVKYEIWYHYLSTLKRHNIPTFLISAIFRNDQHFFKWYGGWWRKMLESYTHIFVQNNASANLLKSIGINSYSIAGDTRFDRVFEIAQNKKDIPLAQLFKSDYPVLVAGSTWAADEDILIDYILNDSSNWKYIIAPHEIKEDSINSLIKKLSGASAVKISNASGQEILTSKVLIIDNIGMLSSLYQYGNIAYIGGGFGKGIHNILEAAVYGMPVLFGPNYQKFNEAVELLNKGGAFSIYNQSELNSILEKIKCNETFRKTSSSISFQYIQDNKGATEIILKHLERL